MNSNLPRSGDNRSGLIGGSISAPQPIAIGDPSASCAISVTGVLYLAGLAWNWKSRSPGLSPGSSVRVQIWVGEAGSQSGVRRIRSGETTACTYIQDLCPDQVQTGGCHEFDC